MTSENVMKPRDRKSTISEYDDGFDMLKLIAVVAMTLDHAAKAFPDVFPDDVALGVGRIAFPAFAVILGARLMASPDRDARYLRRLAVWSALSAPAAAWFAAVTGACANGSLGCLATGSGNIMTTLALGVAVVAGFRRWRGGLIRMMLVVGAGAGGAAVAEYGAVGVLAIPVMALSAHWGVLARRMLRRAMPPLVNLAGGPGMAILAVPAGVMLGLSDRLRTDARLHVPRWSFYAYYPAHLVGLAAAASFAG